MGKDAGCFCLAGGGASRSVPTLVEFLFASRCEARPGTKKPVWVGHIPDCTRSIQHCRAPTSPPRRAVRNHDPCETMSNATQHSRKSGDSRRRHSRGGRNRNQNQDKRRSDERGDRSERDSRDSRGPRDSRDSRSSGRAEEFRLQSPRPPRGGAPAPLSWWQKLLKAIGLYKEPVRPPRPERKSSPEAPAAEARPPKSNTRNARTDDSGAGDRPASSPKRSARGSSERPRGGDGSTVESLRVYVGNLSYDVTEQDLQELFKGVGPVRSVEIVYNRSTHRSKGYGFVEMLRKDEAVRAVEVLHDQHFMGRKLTVSGAKSKGMDDRDEVEDRPTSESRTVTLAPLPPREPEAAVASEPVTAPAAEASPLAEESPEPVIQTIVETVRESAVAEEPQAEVAAEATEDDRPASV